MESLLAEDNISYASVSSSDKWYHLWSESRIADLIAFLSLFFRARQIASWSFMTLSPYFLLEISAHSLFLGGKHTGN
jgi:hypothetical protein